MFGGINRSSRAIAMVAAAALLGLTAACGSGSSDAGGTGADGGVSGGGDGLGSKITMSFDITGAVSVKGDSSSLPAVDNGQDPDNCAAYAKGGKKDDEIHYVLPSFMHDKVGGHQLLVGATVIPYTGPGTYGKDKLTDQGTPAGVDIDGTLYFIQGDTTSEAVINPDGGGSWTFTNLQVQNANNTQGGHPISGKLTWTCKD
jgi:hypothetical protein